MTATDTQVSRATDVLETQIQPEDAMRTPDPQEPQTPFPTSLVLTREQEDIMVEYALAYVDQLEKEMGRVIYASNTTPVPDPNTFFGKREIYTMRYYNHVEDRAVREGGIYRESNITASLSQRTTMQMVARANNFFFGTEPWYSANFVGTEDRTKAEKVDRHSKHKFLQTRLRNVMEEANEFAFVRGESVVKSTYKTTDRHFKRKGRALFDGATNEAVLDSKGNHIFEGAMWDDEVEVIPPPVVEEAPANVVPISPAATDGEEPVPQAPVGPQIQATGRKYLRRDPNVILPATPIYRDGIWPMKQRLFEGPEARVVFYKDFLYPVAAPNIHEAPLICHLYDMPVMSLVQTFKRQDLAAQGAAAGFASLKKAVEAIRQLQGSSIEPQTASSQPRGDFKEEGNQATPDNPNAEVAEVYMTFDADGDGIPEEVMLVIDRKNRFPLFYDYLDNVTPKGKRPFTMIRGKAVDGRAYGMGAMEYFDPEQKFIDLQVNRKNFRESGAGRVTFWNPSCTIEGQSQPGLQLNNGRTYRLREGFKADDALAYVTLPEEGADLMDLLEFFMQLMQLKSGIINAGDQEASGMPTSETATGIRNVEKSGQEMFAQWLSCLEPGHKELLQQQIELLYAYISQPELYRFFNTDTNMEESDTISPEEVAEMDYDVTILLTRVKSEQVLMSSAEARALIKEFYLEYPPQLQPIVAPFFRDSLKALGVMDADQRIVPQPMPVAMPGAPMGGPPAADGTAQAAAAPAAKGVSVPAPPTAKAAQPVPLV
jgi:hypothetical protein